jgi:hypothetical protein
MKSRAASIKLRFAGEMAATSFVCGCGGRTCIRDRITVALAMAQRGLRSPNASARKNTATKMPVSSQHYWAGNCICEVQSDPSSQARFMAGFERQHFDFRIGQA